MFKEVLSFTPSKFRRRVSIQPGAHALLWDQTPLLPAPLLRWRGPVQGTKHTSGQETLPKSIFGTGSYFWGRIGKSNLGTSYKVKILCPSGLNRPKHSLHSPQSVHKRVLQEASKVENRGLKPVPLNSCSPAQASRAVRPLSRLSFLTCSG